MNGVCLATAIEIRPGGAVSVITDGEGDDAWCDYVVRKATCRCIELVPNDDRPARAGQPVIVIEGYDDFKLSCRTGVGASVMIRLGFEAQRIDAVRYVVVNTIGQAVDFRPFEPGAGPTVCVYFHSDGGER